MAKFLKWIQDTATKLIDPDREARVSHGAKALERELTVHKKQFELSQTLIKLQIDESDVEDIVDRVYQVFLSRAWADHELSAAEEHTLTWIAERLQIPTAHAARLKKDAALAVFERFLAHALNDGIVDASETTRLQGIAKAAQSTLPQLMRSAFKQHGEDFLRSNFLKLTSEGLSDKKLAHLIQTAQTLGIPDHELFASIGPQAQQFVEHVLADAKSDGRLSEQEEQGLRWAMRSLRLPQSFVQYLNTQMGELRILTDIGDGKLPVLNRPPEVELRNGELTHFHCAALYSRIKQLKSGPRRDTFHGLATITDLRLVFCSDAASFSLGHRHVVAVRDTHAGIDVLSSAKGAGTYAFGVENRFAIPIYRVAIGRANQTIVERQEGPPGRHIPRAIRQRVWHRYGGRCAECSASEYIEFDHIVPVAKGGSSSENNVQLLCRKCNLKKSDNI